MKQERRIAVVSDETLLRQLAPPLAVTAVVSSAAGLAAALRSKGRVTRAQLVAAVLSSACSGVIVALLLWSRLADDLPTLIGVSSLAGAGGASTLDWLLAHMRARASAGQGD